MKKNKVLIIRYLVFFLVVATTVYFVTTRAILLSNAPKGAKLIYLYDVRYKLYYMSLAMVALVYFEVLLNMDILNLIGTKKVRVLIRVLSVILTVVLIGRLSVSMALRDNYREYSYDGGIIVVKGLFSYEPTYYKYEKSGKYYKINPEIISSKEFFEFIGENSTIDQNGKLITIERNEDSQGNINNPKKEKETDKGKSIEYEINRDEINKLNKEEDEWIKKVDSGYDRIYREKLSSKYGNKSKEYTAKGEVFYILKENKSEVVYIQFDREDENTKSMLYEVRKSKKQKDGSYSRFESELLNRYIYYYDSNEIKEIG